MTSIEISVKKGEGKLFFDGIRLSDGRFILDMRKVHVRVRKQCLIATWANARIHRSCPFAIWGGKHSKDPVPKLQKTLRSYLDLPTRPVGFEGTYSINGHKCAVLRPFNRSSWRVLVGWDYWQLFDGSGLRFESSLPNRDGLGGRHVSGSLRIVTRRGALVGILLPCRPSVSMAKLRESVVKPDREKPA